MNAAPYAGLDNQGRWFVVRDNLRYVWSDSHGTWITEAQKEKRKKEKTKKGWSAKKNVEDRLG